MAGSDGNSATFAKKCDQSEVKDTYAWDNNGNPDNTGDTVTTGNELASDGTWNYTYDPNGNLTLKQSIGTSEKWTYAYNPQNELTEVEHYNTGGTLVMTSEYAYDAFGDQIEDTVITGSSTLVTKFAIDQWNSNMAPGTGNADANVWAVLNGDNTLQTRNIDGNNVDQHLARVDQTGASDAAGVYYLLSDNLNSVRSVLNSSGVVKDSIAYGAFGTITSETDSSYRGWYAWTGRELDVETDLQYNRARWYDANTQRWITQDPLGFDAGDSNLYRYEKNQSSLLSDASGLAPVLHGVLVWNEYSRGKDEFRGNFDKSWETARIKVALAFDDLSVRTKKEQILRLTLQYRFLRPFGSPGNYYGWHLLPLTNNIRKMEPDLSEIVVNKQNHKETINKIDYEYTHVGEASLTLGTIRITPGTSEIFSGTVGVTHGDPSYVTAHARQRIHWDVQIQRGRIAKANVLLFEFDRGWKGNESILKPTFELMRLVKSSYLPQSMWQKPFRPKDLSDSTPKE